MAAKSQHNQQYRQLCKRLKEWREKAGLTQRDLGVKLGKPHTFVAKSEWGTRRVDGIELGKWAVACKVSASDVLEAIGVPLKPKKWAPRKTAQ